MHMGILTAVLSYAILYAVIIVAGICTGGVKLAPTQKYAIRLFLWINRLLYRTLI